MSSTPSRAGCTTAAGSCCWRRRSRPSTATTWASSARASGSRSRPTWSRTTRVPTAARRAGSSRTWSGIERPWICSRAAGDPQGAELKSATDALRLAQEPDASVALARHDAAEVHALVERMARSVEGLAPRFEHQADYLEAAVEDLHAWAVAGFGKPDFGRSLELFRPDLHRRDGIEHLVLFPMYLQNSSRDRRFEA